MANKYLINATKGKAKSITLCNKKLDSIPTLLCQITTVEHLELKNNSLKFLPFELGTLTAITSLNLGNNEFEELPLVVGSFSQLRSFHIFNNKLKELNGLVLQNLYNCVLLNANNNLIHIIPPEIGTMMNLKILCVEKNNIESIPSELINCRELTEIHLGNNSIRELPKEIGKLNNLKKLILYKNDLEFLPEEIGGCAALEVLDVSCNYINMFPATLTKCQLHELYYDENPLLQRLPVKSQHADDIFYLKELCARVILQSFKDRVSPLRKQCLQRPDVLAILKEARKCAFCDKSYLFSWLECAKFVPVKTLLCVPNKSGNVPIKVCLCSYDCFYSEGHDYFAVSYPVTEEK